jgi:transposase InsO family protein
MRWCRSGWVHAGACFTEEGEDGVGVVEVGHRSDHGVQFGSWVFTRRVHEAGLAPSMGSIGDCYEYLEIFHNRQRRHTALGMLTPTEHERLHPTVLSVA